MAEKNSFALRNMGAINSGLFTPTDPAIRQKAFYVFLLPLSSLHPLDGHQFRLYTGKRFDDMVESIRENGVILPIIVRPKGKDSYEILSGHNRVEASRVAELEKVPAIIRENLSEDEARLIATVTNLIQRSFAEMSHSERAYALSEYYGAIKSQGRRTDLINEIENMANLNNTNTSETFVGIQHRSSAREKTAKNYGLNSNTVAQYIRINRLITPLKDQLDIGKIGISTADILSHLAVEAQRTVDEVLSSNHCKLDIKKADALRATYERGKINHKIVEMILSGEKNINPPRPAVFKLRQNIMSKYFKPEQKAAEIEATIIEALEFYYASRCQGGTPNEPA